MASAPPLESDKRILRPERLVRRTLPLNVREHERRLFAGDLERTLPPVRTRDVRGLRITPDGFLFKGLRLLPESFPFPSLKDELSPRTRSRLLAESLVVRRHRRFTGRALWISDTWSVGYFHWLADALPRLYLSGDLAAESTLLLPHAYRTLDYVRESLQPFTIGAIEFLRQDEVLHCQTLTLPDHAAPSGHFDEEIVRQVRERLLARHATPSATTAARVYVSRAHARRRRIANEAAVIDVLRARDFRIVEAERLSFRDQVSLWSTADVFVSNHGAGLTNMMFMPAGAQVLELRHENDAVNNCYFTLAGALALDYFFQSCAAATPGGDPHTADVIVDVGRLAANLDLMLG